MSNTVMIKEQPLYTTEANANTLYLHHNIAFNSYM